MIPASLKFGAALLVCAVLSAPVSLYVQHQESKRQGQATGRALTGGDPEAGKAAIAQYGCGGCHEVPGVAGAKGKVGPSLSGVGRRPVVAGRLMNDPRTLTAWIRAPQTLEPGSAMPDLGAREADAHDIAAYLYTLK